MTPAAADGATLASGATTNPTPPPEKAIFRTATGVTTDLATKAPAAADAPAAAALGPAAGVDPASVLDSVRALAAVEAGCARAMSAAPSCLS